MTYESIYLEDETNQKTAFRDYYKLQGLTDDQISRKIERYEDADMLEDEATDAVEYLKKYQSERLEEAKAQQEILKVAEQLERYRARNFNYRNFTATNVELPSGYYLNIYDLDDNTKGLNSDVQGRGWYIKVTPDINPKNHYFLMGSNGLKCKSTIEADVNFKCEPWNESTKAGSQPW